MAEASGQDMEPVHHPRSEAVLPSHGIEINIPASHGRPSPIKTMSAPAYQSPIRHHRRVSSRTRAVKETLNAQSYHGSGDDEHGVSMHRINQYTVKQEIGRGSFGAVHLAVDQYGKEYAVKEFSKSRLRKRAQSNLLRQSHQKKGLGRILPFDRANNNSRPFDLIKEEIAIMKKLNHNNVVNLIEVLDDPHEDTLYMVLEMCKKGIVMQVGLDDRAEPYSDDACRCWFRDMILGIEYLHAQGIIHRDIKPDNCLVTEDDVLKIVDFGVSEMFEKSSNMSTTKSAGSPAFMPPELCVAKHGPISGRAADIWSMGVTLYCLRYGQIPFEKQGMLELYDSIRQDQVPLNNEKDGVFRELMTRLLEKDPDKRITMAELRVHPWVTKNGTDPLLSEEENCAEIVEPPTEVEMQQAITGNMANLLVVMKAVNRFKNLIAKKRPALMQSILGTDKFSAPPGNIRDSRSADAHDRKPVESVLATEGIHHEIAEPLSRAATFPQDDHAKGHAHDPLRDTLYLNMGDNLEMTVSESPGGVEEPIYEQAYRDEMDRIMSQRGGEASMYLNRRVEHREDLRSHDNIVDRSRAAAKTGMRQLSNMTTSGWADVVKQVQSSVATTAEQKASVMGLDMYKET